MNKMIKKLLSDETITIAELQKTIKEVRYSNDKEIYSDLTVEDMNLADEVLSYISSGKDIDYIRQKMNGH